MFLSSSFPYTHLFLYLHKYKFTVSDREPPKEATSPARPVPRWPGIVYLQSEGVDPWWQWVNMHIWVMLSYETRSFESNLAMVKSTEHSPYLYAYMLLYIYTHALHAYNWYRWFSHKRYQLCLIRTGFTQFTKKIGDGADGTTPMARPARRACSLSGAMQGELDWASIQMTYTLW